MLINDTDRLNVQLLETEDGNDFITVIITNELDEELGRLRILKSRYDTFLLALGTMIRDNYSFFEPRERSISKLVNQTTGTIEFVEE
jgi:hypothetical protein